MTDLLASEDGFTTPGARLSGQPPARSRLARPAGGHPSVEERWQRTTPDPDGGGMAGTVSTDYRILITGSRTWRNSDRIAFELGLAIGESGHCREDIVIVHGACPSGADAIAAALARDFGCRTDPRPADWEAPCIPGQCRPGHRRMRGGASYCPAAGNYRNAAMVSTMPDLVLAFIRDHSPGASHCARLAGEAGLTMRRFTDG